MRYFHAPAIEAYESAWVPQLNGKTYNPGAMVQVSHDSWLSHPGSVTTEEVDGELLVIEPETASWAFMSPAEFAAYRQLHHRSAGDVLADTSDTGEDTGRLISFAYRRGLLEIDSHRSTDPTIFRDGHNSPEVHLVELLVTERCNLGCVYCLAGTAANMPRMNRDTALRAVDLAFAMVEADEFAFELSGGEPFLEFPLMRDIVDHIGRRQRSDGRHVSINVQTNCTLLNPDRVQWLADNDINVGISLDGSPRNHDRSRPLLGGKGSFAKVIDGIDLMQRAGVPFGALVVLNRWNIDDPRELADFMVENGIHGFKLNPVAYLGTARSTWTDIGVTSAEVIDYTQNLARLVGHEGYPLRESNLHGMCEFLVSKRRAVRCMRSHCGAGDTFQAVAADGTIYPCGRSTQSPGLALGSVHDQQVQSLSGPARKSLVIAEIRERRPHNLDGCTTCSYRQLCQAGCSAQAYERYGTVRHRTPECDMYKTAYPWLMRWLSWDAAALDRFSQLGYFGTGGAQIVDSGFRAAPVAAVS